LADSIFFILCRVKSTGKNDQQFQVAFKGGQTRISTAAVGPGIATVELLDVELLRAEPGTNTGLRERRMKVAFVGGIATPFPETLPETEQQARGGLSYASHQSSPCAAPE
jgi:hypothetical protein